MVDKSDVELSQNKVHAAIWIPIKLTKYIHNPRKNARKKASFVLQWNERICKSEYKEKCIIREVKKWNLEIYRLLIYIWEGIQNEINR